MHIRSVGHRVTVYALVLVSNLCVVLTTVLHLKGSNASLMMALFVMCSACLVGTALVAFKKSRDKPVGYTVLANNGDQE